VIALNIFKGKIICTNCHKKYNYRLDHGIPCYICGGRKNYGIKFCSSKTLVENDLLDIVKRHCEINQKPYEDIADLINKILVDEDGGLTIIYTDGKKSITDSHNIIY
jgi:hypothetical protein